TCLSTRSSSFFPYCECEPLDWTLHRIYYWINHFHYGGTSRDDLRSYRSHCRSNSQPGYFAWGRVPLCGSGINGTYSGCGRYIEIGEVDPVGASPRDVWLFERVGDSYIHESVRPI